jgi:UDP-N-acetylglucosamine--N-acetylmuramyl-(pentapeptide) pyrophosphoryl-undecaprenol N-acetylglucosamine transferase
MKVLISGGGTGGHIFPAIAIADALRKLQPTAEIRFVGAEGRMEMERVPKAGYPIEGLPVAGLQRRLTFKNLLVPFKLLLSLWKAWRIVRRFRPDAAVGVGGYASAPVLLVASTLGLPTVIQEQNSHAGLTNRLLGKRVNRICVAYEQVGRFFPANKIIMTGNPVRADLVELAADPNRRAQLRTEGQNYYGLQTNRPTILVVGGSLGARTLNESVKAYLELLATEGVQVLWQVGRLYEKEYEGFAAQYPNLVIRAFLDRMDLAYAVADVVISRAGALSLAEICLVGLPSVLVPSPNVAEDHQTANARALADRAAAILVTDAAAREQLIPTTLALVSDPANCERLAHAARQMGIADAADRIAHVVADLINQQTHK